MTSVEKSCIISKLIGAEVPKELTIKSPLYVHTKGSGKRIAGSREIVIEKSKRLRRVCGNCKKLGFLDKRTCPQKVSSSSITEASGAEGQDEELEDGFEENIDI